MNLRKFINDYFHSWTITQITSCGTERGVIKLRHSNTFIKIFFDLNGDTHWTGERVTVDRVESAE